MRRMWLVAAALAACRSDYVVGELVTVAEIKAIPNRNLDILFVVDNSGSMLDSQAELAARFPLMMDALAQLPDGLPDLHIGVVTSDMGTSSAIGPNAPRTEPVGAGGCADAGDDGVLRTTAAMHETFISDLDDGAGGRARNYDGELRDVFGTIAQVGGNGCGFEQHLSAMRRGLTNPLNSGFIRPDANLAVVILADEDDCSARSPALFGPDSEQLGTLQSFRCTRTGLTCDQPIGELGDKTHCVSDPESAVVEDIQPFVDAVIAVKGDPRTVLVGAIVGDPDPVTVVEQELNGVHQPQLAPSCVYPTPTGEATAGPAVRIAQFLAQFPGRSDLHSICAPELGFPMQQIGDSARRLIHDPCIDVSRLADVSPDDGMQVACEVVDVRDSQPDAVFELPACDGVAGDCYTLTQDAAACPGDRLRLDISRSTAATVDTWTRVRCQPR